jgi:hypothetical protein
MKNLLIRIALVIVTSCIVVAVMQPMMHDLEFDAEITQSSLNANIKELKKVNSDLRFMVLGLENKLNDLSNTPSSIDEFLMILNNNRGFANTLGGVCVGFGLILGLLFGLSMRRKAHGIEIQKINDHVNFLNKERSRHLIDIKQANDELKKTKDDLADITIAYEKLQMQKARRA